MSLINDAIKRAQGVPPPVSQNAPILPTAEIQNQRTLYSPAIYMSLVLFAFVGGMWFLFKGLRSASSPPDSEAQAVAARSAGGEPVAVEATPLAGSVNIGGVSYSAANVTPEILADPKTRTTAKEVPAASREFALDAGRSANEAAIPDFRLQGIFYRVRNPSAVINAKSVFVGDSIGGAQVRSIDRSTVTLERNGQTEVLTLKGASE